LASSVLESGGIVSGAVALNNTAWNEYRAVDVGLVAVETITLPGANPSNRESQRFEIQIPVDRPQEGAPIPFRFRLPGHIPPSFGSRLWRLAWYFEARAHVRWRSDVRLRIPVTLIPGSQKPSAEGRRYPAPPSVGSERVEKIWHAVAAELGLQHEEGALRGSRGDVTYEVRREHRGRSGVFLVGEVSYPSLHLALGIRPAKGLDRALRKGVQLGDEAWDRRHVVRGRDEAQVATVVGALRGALIVFQGTTMDDEHAILDVRGAGQNHRRLLAFCRAVTGFSIALEPARSSTPPPASMTAALPGWRELGRRLGAPLETARMAVSGELDGLPAEVVTEWSQQGEALRTLLRIEPNLSVSPELEVHLEADGEGETSLEEWPAARGEVRALLASLLDGAHSLDVRTKEIRLAMDAPINDPVPLVGRLADMARLSLMFRPGSGPFR
jgi:hypothetical protein